MVNTKQNYKGLNVGVVGLGISGMSGVNYLVQKGANVFASDFGDGSNLNRGMVESLETKGVQFEFGGHTAEFLRNVELALVGPGVPLNSKIIEFLKRQKTKIVGELALVSEDIDKPIVAVTGTNGKTTVTGLVDTILRSSGKTTFEGGNIGTPAYEYCIQKNKSEVLVLEVSSFQLDLSGNFAPHVGVLLNITPDHIDRHGNVENYVSAKMNLFRYQNKADFAVLNHDDKVCREHASSIKPAYLLRFGHDDFCDAVIKEGSVLVKWEGNEELYELSDTRLDNPIGAMNSAAAILAAKAMGCDYTSIKEGLKSYEPLSHRMEFVREIGGVKYINDSKATNTGAVISGLEQVVGKSAILIAGGRDKGDDYSLLEDVVKRKVKSLILIGEAAQLISKKLVGVTDVLFADDLQLSILLAKERAVTGDVVLLSPACASFDMFSSYSHRGKEFTRIVNSL